MARLNEPPQPSVESIDALKRRFVRQNREIARANSTQSLRIRNLESEVTRLLSENVSLREQIIKLHYEAERNIGRSVLEGVDVVKGKLEAKLAELGGLVQELGNVRKNVDSQRAQRRRSINRSSPKRSPDQRNWKNALTLSEVTGGADGRLPPIVEDKYFPRRTMDAEEMLGIFADPTNTTDSPDLGPPPVAHFEEGDPIKFDPTQEQSPREGSAGSTEEVQPKLSANLETRKKRRESSHRKDVDLKNANVDSSKSTASMATDMPSSQPLKSGAKRKLNVRDEDDKPAVVDELGEKNIQLNRRSSDLRMSDNGNTKPILSRAVIPASDKAPRAAISSISGKGGNDAKDGKEKASGAPATVTATGRKALGPKSVNTDPMNSPTKVSRSSKDKVAEAKDDLAKIAPERNRLKDKTRPKNPGIVENKEIDIKDAGVTKSVEVPPETPAPPPSDLFSPGPSEPSAARQDSRDTPPPPDLGPDTGTGSFGRASRRPRGSVNYAQPNLRDKMRRPTKELVDAVGAEERARIAKAEDDASKPIFIKQEEDADATPTWKSNAPKNDQRTRPEPTSPLGNKIGAADLPASVITERRRRTFVPTLNDDALDLAKPASGAASAIAALTGGIQRSKRREEEGEPSGDVEKREQTREPIDRTSIYDFTGSSPVDPSGRTASDIDQEALAKTVRSSRRHSSVPASVEPGKGSIMISRRGDRRRETLVGRESGENAEKAEGQISRTKDGLNLVAGSEEAAIGRGERAASRRRSMMI